MVSNSKALQARNASDDFPVVSFKPLVEAYNALTEKLQPLVYDLGFLKNWKYQRKIEVLSLNPNPICTNDIRFNPVVIYGFPFTICFRYGAFFVSNNSAILNFLQFFPSPTKLK